MVYRSETFSINVAELHRVAATFTACQQMSRSGGHALIDTRLSLLREWINDPRRCRAADWRYVLEVPSPTSVFSDAAEAAVPT